jgi:hypothetical protein
MALARVVTFEGVNTDHMAQLQRQLDSGEQPEGLAATEIVALHDPEAQTSMVIVFFDSEDDYARGDAVLGAMPAGDTPGTRTSITKYTVAARATA